MKKTAKRFLSMLLVLTMVAGLLVFPAAATETEEPAEAVETAAETTPAVEEADVRVEGTFFAPVLFGDGEVVIDEEDPAIIAMEDSLENVKVLGAEGNPVPLTEEEKQTLLGLYQQYMKHWAENAHLLGVQTPFFLSYNDGDELGVLGEMLVLANIPLEAVRAGMVKYSDLEGMLQTFLFADMIGVQTFGDAIVAARDEVMDLIDKSGAQTEAQKLLILNDWLAHNVTFDMPYIMNNGKEDGEKPMVAPNPQKDPYEDAVYGAIEEIYKGILQQTFEQNIKDGLKAVMMQTYYEGAIQELYYQVMLEGMIGQEAQKKGSTYFEDSKVAFVNDWYEKNKEGEAYQKAYNEAYNAYLDENCEHDFDVKFTIADEADEEGNYAATADLTCKKCGREHKNVKADVAVTTEAANCQHGNKTTKTATVTVDGFTFSKEEKSDDGKTTDHVDVAEPVDGKCDECSADMPTTEGGEDAQTVDAQAQDEQTAETVAADAELQAAAAEHAVEAAKTALQDAANDAYDALSDEMKLELAKNQVKANETVLAALDANAKAAAEKYMADNADAIAKDAVAFLNSQDLFKTQVPVTDAEGNVVKGEDGNPVMMSLADQIHEGWKAFWTDAETNGIPGMIGELKLTAYQEAIKGAVAQGAVQNGMTEEQANAYAESYLEEHKDAIAEDPYAFCVENFGKDTADYMEKEINSQLTQMGFDVSTQTNPEGRVSLKQIVAQQMDTPQQDPMLQKRDENGNPIEGEYMTPNEAIPVFAAQAAAGMTEPVLNYWQGSQFGALGRGSAVCLGYTKAFTYLVQYMHPEVYGTSATADMSKPENWKSRDDLYVYDENGNIDITKNYVVDAVRVTFDAEVTMFGSKEENFNSDHFWNAVKVDGEWYYIDPCYTDVFTLVMARDRVETDGYMNHLYFLFSHSSAMQLYDGNYEVIKTLYYDDATGTDYTSKDYEDSWFSRIKSNTYFADGYAYYLYDSTDMLTLLEEFEEEQKEIDFTAIQKIVRHKLDDTDKGDGDEDYEPLIVLNYEDKDGVYHARVWDPATGAAENNEMLTKLYDRHGIYASTYPSINVTMGLYNGKIYFNVANCIVSYDIATSEVAVVKEYNTVHGVRDKTNPFGGMAFTVTTADNADFTVENHPIAALTIKEDGNMYVSVATNFGFISGKNRLNPADQSSYGYEFEESNYNVNYSSYNVDDSGYTDSELEQYGYVEQTNDNDEFMWTANFVEKLPLAHFAGSEHTYEAVSVDAFCGVNAYTENRCTTCGKVEADTRDEVKDSAHDHHYIKFDEIYYTKDDGDAWNTGFCYVCTMCGYAVSEPTEPSDNGFGSIMGGNSEEEQEEYERKKAEYEAAAASAGHDYVPADAEWSKDNTQVTFSTLECGNVCATRKPYLDVLLNDATITAIPKEKITADAEFVGYYGDDYAVYQAAGEAECDVNGETKTVAYTASKLIELEDSKVTRVSGSDRYETALDAAELLKEIQEVETFDNIVVASGASFPDALSGSYLATELDAPILLTQEKSQEEILTYITENLSAKGKVYILGGNSSVSASFETALKDAQIDCTRLSGPDRYQTNLEILGEAGLNGKKILVCTGTNFADSLAASATNLPILLVDGKASELNAHQTEFLERVENCTFYIVGGPNTVSAEIETQLQNYGEVKRVAGQSREETSVKVAEEFFENPDTAVLAYSRNFPDGLSGGPVAYALDAPLLLVNAGAESYAVEYVASNEIEMGVVMGGANSISDETIRTIFAMPIHDKIMER